MSIDSLNGVHRQESRSTSGRGSRVKNNFHHRVGHQERAPSFEGCHFSCDRRNRSHPGMEYRLPYHEDLRVRLIPLVSAAPIVMIIMNLKCTSRMTQSRMRFPRFWTSLPAAFLIGSLGVPRFAERRAHARHCWAGTNEKPDRSGE